MALPTEELSEYELQRRRNIAANEQELIRLQLLTPPKPRPRSEPKKPASKRPVAASDRVLRKRPPPKSRCVDADDLKCDAHSKSRRPNTSAAKKAKFIHRPQLQTTTRETPQFQTPKRETTQFQTPTWETTQCRTPTRETTQHEVHTPQSPDRWYESTPSQRIQSVCMSGVAESLIRYCSLKSALPLAQCERRVSAADAPSYTVSVARKVITSSGFNWVYPKRRMWVAKVRYACQGADGSLDSRLCAVGLFPTPEMAALASAVAAKHELRDALEVVHYCATQLPRDCDVRVELASHAARR